MNVFIGCEYSGIVRDAFIKKGHNAISCDIIESESTFGDHIVGDIIDTLSVVDDKFYDIIICHPPCTYLCVSGNRYYADSNERINAIYWTEMLWELCKKKSKAVCFENPVGVLSTKSKLGKPTQYIQPWMFGHKEKKKTGLWLYNLKKLKETNNVYHEMMKLPEKEQSRIHYCSPGKNRGKIRSRFFTGIADAMVEHWSITNV